MSLDTGRILNVAKKQLLSPSYLPKIRSKDDLKEIKAVQDGYGYAKGFEGIVIDLDRTKLLAKKRNIEDLKVWTSFDDEKLPENLIMLIDPRLDLLSSRQLSQGAARSFIEAFDKMALFNVSASFSSSRKHLEEARARLASAAHRKRLFRGAPEYSEAHLKAKNVVEQIELSLVKKIQTATYSNEFIRAIVAFQLSWGSDVIIPPYLPINLGLSTWESPLKALILSYKVTKELASKTGKVTAFPICFDMISKEKSRTEDEKMITRSGDVIAELLSSIEPPEAFVIRVAKTGEGIKQCGLYLRTVVSLRKSGTIFLHGLDPGSVSILGLCYFNHGLNSFSCVPSRPPATGGHGELKVEGRYLWPDSFELVNGEKLVKYISDRGEMPCKCNVCNAYIKVSSSKGEFRIRGLNEIFFDRKKGAPKGGRDTTRDRRVHHFLFNLLGLQSLSRTNPDGFAQRIQECSENCDTYTVVLETLKELLQ